METTVSGKAEAATDLSAYSKYIVAQDANGAHILATAGTDNNCGILKDGGRAAGDHLTLVIGGRTRAKAGGSINEGDAVTATTGGKAIATITANDRCIGYCRQIGGAVDGDEFDIDVCFFNY